jgi:hypothetical protein
VVRVLFPKYLLFDEKVEKYVKKKQHHSKYAQYGSESVIFDKFLLIAELGINPGTSEKNKFSTYFKTKDNKVVYFTI